MLKNSRYHILIIGSIMFFIMIAVLALAIQPKAFNFSKSKSQAPATPVTVKTKVRVYDSVLLKKLDKVFKNLDFGKLSYTLSGNITVVNSVDSAETMKNVFFLISKSNKDFYYKEGETETINEDGAYICINSQTKKIFISKQKTINTASIIDVEKLKGALLSENYALLSNIKNGRQTISMVNEYHISCKEYNLTFDTLTNKPTRIYIRLTNINEPLNKSRDKVIDIKITQLDNEAMLDKYVTKNTVVYNNGKNWKLTKAYTGYDLIQL
jgi:hypothetical protein